MLGQQGRQPRLVDQGAENARGRYAGREAPPQPGRDLGDRSCRHVGAADQHGPLDRNAVERLREALGIERSRNRSVPATVPLDGRRGGGHEGRNRPPSEDPHHAERRDSRADDDDRNG